MFPAKTRQIGGIGLALWQGMLSTYLTAFFAMGFAACSFLVFKATVDHMWHLGE